MQQNIVLSLLLRYSRKFLSGYNIDKQQNIFKNFATLHRTDWKLGVGSHRKMQFF